MKRSIRMSHEGERPGLFGLLKAGLVEVADNNAGLISMVVSFIVQVANLGVWVQEGGGAIMKTILIAGALYDVALLGAVTVQALLCRKDAWLGYNHWSFPRTPLQETYELVNRARKTVRKNLRKNAEAQLLLTQAGQLYESVLNIYEAAHLQGRDHLLGTSQAEISESKRLIRQLIGSIDEMEEQEKAARERNRENRGRAKRQRKQEKILAALGASAVETSEEEMQKVLKMRTQSVQFFLNEKNEIEASYQKALKELRENHGAQSVNA